MSKCPRGIRLRSVGALKRQSTCHRIVSWILVLQSVATGLVSSQSTGATSLLLPQSSTFTESQLNKVASMQNATYDLPVDDAASTVTLSSTSSSTRDTSSNDTPQTTISLAKSYFDDVTTGHVTTPESTLTTSPNVESLLPTDPSSTLDSHSSVSSVVTKTVSEFHVQPAALVVTRTTQVAVTNAAVTTAEESPFSVTTTSTSRIQKPTAVIVEATSPDESLISGTTTNRDGSIGYEPRFETTTFPEFSISSTRTAVTGLQKPVSHHETTTVSGEYAESSTTYPLNPNMLPEYSQGTPTSGPSQGSLTTGSSLSVAESTINESESAIVKPSLTIPQSQNIDRAESSVSIVTVTSSVSAIHSEKEVEISTVDMNSTESGSSNITTNHSTLLRRSGDLLNPDNQTPTISSSIDHVNTQDSMLPEASNENPSVVTYPGHRFDDVMLGDQPMVSSSSAGRQERSFVRTSKYPEQGTQVEPTPVTDSPQTIQKESSYSSIREETTLSPDQLLTLSPIDNKHRKDDLIDNGDETSAEATTIVETSSEIVTAMDGEESLNNSVPFLAIKQQQPTQQTFFEPSNTTSESNATFELSAESILNNFTNISSTSMKNITGIGIKTTVSVSLNVSNMPNMTGDDNSVQFDPLDITEYLQRKSTNKDSNNIIPKDNSTSENNLEFSPSNSSVANPGDLDKNVLPTNEDNITKTVSNSTTTLVSTVNPDMNSTTNVSTITESASVVPDNVTDVSMTPGVISQNSTENVTTTTVPTTTRRNRFIFPKKPSRKPTTTTTTTTTKKPKLIRTSPRRRPSSTTPSPANKTSLTTFKPPSTRPTTTTPSTTTLVINATLFTIPAEPETTVSTPYVPEPVIKVGGIMKITHGVIWKPQLNDRNSPEFKELSKIVKAMLHHLYEHTYLQKRIKQIEIDGFSEGSVIVDYILYLRQADDMPEPQNLRDVFNNRLTAQNTYGQFHLDPASTEFEIITIWRPKATPTPVTEPPIPQWAIAVIVIGSASLIFIILFGAVTVYGRHHAYRKYGAKLQEDDAEKATACKDWESKVAAAYENLAADGVYDMDEVAEKNRKNTVLSSGKQTAKDRAYDSWRTDWSAHPGKKIRQSIDTSF